MRRTPTPPLTERQRALLSQARRIVYATPSEGPELALHLYLPRDYAEGPPRPGLLFFHGGAWDRGSAAELAPHALHFVARGAVAVLAEYRHRGTHAESRPADSHEDAEAAMRYLLENSGTLHLDPGRIVVVGASAGANLAGALALKTPPKKAAGTRIRPAAAVLVSAVFDPSQDGPWSPFFATSEEARSLALPRLATRRSPPLLVVHGTADRLVPFEAAESFVARMVRLRNRCRLAEFEGRDRGFHHHNLDPLSFEALLSEVASFLDETGVLPQSPDDPEIHLVSQADPP